MLNFRCALCILFFTISLDKVNLLENGMARTPPMGWMSWGYYMCGIKCEADEDKCLNEKLILSVADTFFMEGYQEAGYEYIIIDDCWSEKQRDKNGRLVADKKRFPRGMKYIADYIHSLGLKFGMYTNIADITCMRYPGSLNHMEVDAQTFAEWGVDYLKVDGCFVSEGLLNEGYIKLGQYLNNTGRPMVYSCSWPYYIEFIHAKRPDYKLISKYCNLWRNYHDVQTSWISIAAILSHYQRRYTQLAPHHGPGHWNDPDMLIFGSGVLTRSQSRVQLTLMAMLSAPILLSCNMKLITPYEKELLQNMDLIAIAQDPLGIMAQPHELPGASGTTTWVKAHLPKKGDLFHSYTFAVVKLDVQDGDIFPIDLPDTSGTTTWVKPHLPKKGDLFPSYTFAVVNLDVQDVEGSIKLSRFSLNATDGYTVLNVFTGEYFLNVSLTDTLDVMVPGMDVVLYTLYPL